MLEKLESVLYLEKNKQLRLGKDRRYVYYSVSNWL